MEGTHSSSELILGFSEKESRRQSQCSSQTASVSDSIEDTGSVPTLDITIEEDYRNGNNNSGDCNLVEWTKQFHSVVEEAPLIESTIIHPISQTLHNNGIQAKEPFVTNGRGEKEKENGERAETMECDWIDHELLEEGRKFVRRNFFAVLLAHFIGVAFLLTVRPIQSLLLRTSSLHRKENTLRRYLKMILYLKRFYESPVSIAENLSDKTDLKNDCREEIIYIQNLQRNAAKNFKVYVPPPWEDLKLTLEEQEVYQAVQEDTKELGGICMNAKNLPKILSTVNPDVPMSQYDLVIMQYAFYGFIAHFPGVFGIYEKIGDNGSSKGLKGFIHLWAVLGRIFGIDDRFNLCISRNYDVETNQLVFSQIFMYSFKSINASAMRLWRSMTSGSSRYFFFFRTKALMLFMCKDVAHLESCKQLNSVMKPMEKFCYYFYKFLINWLLWVPPFRVVINYSFRFSICICQYFMNRAKKCESKWDAPTVCVIEPALVKEINGNNNGMKI